MLAARDTVMCARRIRARLTRDSPYEPLRERPGFQPDPDQRQAELAEEADQRLRLARYLGLANDPAAAVDHAHAAQFQRHVDPGIMLHGCPSMMPGADPFGPRTRHHFEGQPPRQSEPAWARYGIYIVALGWPVRPD